MVKRFPTIHHEQALRRDYDQDTPIAIERPFNKVVFHPDRLDKPLHWRKPRRVGVCFMGDLFDEQVPSDWQSNVYDIMDQCPKHLFFILTKQAKIMANRLAGVQRLDNIWHGVSICDQEDADRMIPDLLKVPGKKWVSIEPMLGKTRLDWALDHPQRTAIEQLGWIVCGAESGPKRRPCYWPWMIDVVEQCRAAGVPVYVKQMLINGRVSHNPEEWPEELRVQDLP